MGAWGNEPDANDTALDLLSVAKAPLLKALRVPKKCFEKRPVKEVIHGSKPSFPMKTKKVMKCIEDWQVTDAIAASFFFYEITKNAKLRYHMDLEYLRGASQVLGDILKFVEFSNWRNPKARRLVIVNLKKNIDRFLKKATYRCTTLFVNAGVSPKKCFGLKETKDEKDCIAFYRTPRRRHPVRLLKRSPRNRNRNRRQRKDGK